MKNWRRGFKGLHLCDDSNTMNHRIISLDTYVTPLPQIDYLFSNDELLKFYLLATSSNFFNSRVKSPGGFKRNQFQFS